MSNEDSSTFAADSPGEHPIHRRLQRVEEGLGFSEHTIEQMHTLVLDLGRRVDALTRRLAALEAAQRSGADGRADGKSASDVSGGLPSSSGVDGDGRADGPMND